ncbi:MAG: hypothetical protein AB9M53_08135, partial [Leptothrix sp. (in: b-proteobacteria)]
AHVLFSTIDCPLPAGYRNATEKPVCKILCQASLAGYHGKVEREFCCASAKRVDHCRRDPGQR